MRKAAAVTAAIAAALALSPAPARGAADVQLLGGYRQFTDTAGDVLDGGPAYGVGVTVGVTPFLGVEGWYQGATMETASGLTLGDRRVFQNGVGGVLKLGPQDTRVRPYAFGGAEWDWFSADATNVVVQDESYLTVPLGAGVDVDLTNSRSGALTLGARGSYRLGFGEDVFRTASMDRADQFQVAAVLGAHF